MKVKDRVWRPSPHISNLSVEVIAFLQKAAGAFSLPPVKVNKNKQIYYHPKAKQMDQHM